MTIQEYALFYAFNIEQFFFFFEIDSSLEKADHLNPFKRTCSLYNIAGTVVFIT